MENIKDIILKQINDEYQDWEMKNTTAPYDVNLVNIHNRKWAIGALLLLGVWPEGYKEIGISEACVIIPVDQLKDMSDHELAENIRLLTEPAEIMFAEILSSWVRYGGRDDWQNMLPALEKFKGKSPRIDNAILALQTIKNNELKREQAKNNKQIKRNKINSQYDNLFVKIGRRDGFNCAICGCTASDLQIDHKIPIVLNGSNDLDNLQLLCKSCNIKKCDKLI